MIRPVLILLLSASAVITPAGAAQARGDRVACGDLITKNTRLTADLHCSGARGLTLAGGVTLDLGGHSLVGQRDLQSTGIGVMPGEPSRVIRGRITGWTMGITSHDQIDPTTTQVEDVVFARNGFGIYAVSQTFSFNRTVFTDNDEGIWGYTSTFDITNSVFSKNGSATFATGAGALRISSSLFWSNGIAVGCSEVRCSLRNSILRDNDNAVDSWYSGIVMQNNDVSGSETAVSVRYNPGVPDQLIGNRFHHNGTAVFVGQYSLLSMRGNVVKHNVTGITSQSDIESYSADLIDNTFTQNRDGVYLPAPGAPRLMGNSATRNSRWGIFAPAAVDLGGNTARRNGANPQCVGVTCTPG